MQLLQRSTAVPDDPDHPARRWFRRWSLWPPVLELPAWIRWVQASPAYPDHPIAGALIAAAAPLKPWIWLTPSFPTHVLAGVHFVPIGPEGQSALDGDPDDQQRRRFGTRSYGDLSDAVVVIGELATAGSGAPVSFNREVRRIVDGLRIPDQSLEQFLEVMTVRRADGREISLREFPLAQAMSTGETVRAE